MLGSLTAGQRFNGRTERHVFPFFEIGIHVSQVVQGFLHQQ